MVGSANSEDGVKVFVRGNVVDGADATVSVFDRGFLYGDSVYEVMRTAGGNPVDYDRHLLRLARSARSIGLPLPTAGAIRAAVKATLSAAQNSESYVRTILTRGSGTLGLDIRLATDASLLVIVKPLALPPQHLFEKGAALRIVGVRRTSREAVDPSVKSGNYLNNILALAEASDADADEAVMLSPEGLVAEGATSNIFVVIDGEISTPALATGLLAGITRRRILELGSASGFQVSERALSPNALRDADEVFITSSIRGVMPVRRVDECEKPVPGTITKTLMSAYADFLADEAKRPPA